MTRLPLYALLLCLTACGGGGEAADPVARADALPPVLEELHMEPRSGPRVVGVCSAPLEVVCDEEGECVAKAAQMVCGEVS